MIQCRWSGAKTNRKKMIKNKKEVRLAAFGAITSDDEVYSCFGNEKNCDDASNSTSWHIETWRDKEIE